MVAALQTEGHDADLDKIKEFIYTCGLFGGESTSNIDIDKIKEFNYSSGILDGEESTSNISHPL